MKRFAVFLALAGALTAGGARAQISGGGGPIDVTADSLEMIDAQKLAIWRGNVDAVQGENRILADQINVYFANTGAAGAAAPKPSPAKAAGSAPAAGGVGRNWGEVQRMVAEGHVFFVSPQQTARGDHAVYEVIPDTVTITGDVVVVQGENVIRGQSMVIEVKTGHGTVVSAGKGRNAPQRVRAVLYSKPAAGAPSAKPAAGAPAPAAPAAAAAPK